MQDRAVARTADSPPDQDAWLFADLYGPLRRFAAVVGPVEVDPDDLVQEAVVRVLRRGRLSELNDPGAYLRKTMLNVASNHRRRFAVRRRALERLRAEALPASDVYPSDLVDLVRLAPQERAVLYLSAVEGYRYAEIARMLGCSEAAARKRAMKARRRLRDSLVEEVAGG
jgi:RNA polymerase sigma-70 factor (ECF subfamily)